jgi:hypothetical protein
VSNPLTRSRRTARQTNYASGLPRLWQTARFAA